jgi:hypothetical protein
MIALSGFRAGCLTRWVAASRGARAETGGGAGHSTGGRRQGGHGRWHVTVELSGWASPQMLATTAPAELFARHPQGVGRYAGRLVCRALCQGLPSTIWTERMASRTYFDVWVFLHRARRRAIPVSVAGTADYGRSKFGRYPDDPPSFTGRRVDLLRRSLDVPLDAEPAKVSRDYLSVARTRSSNELAAKRSSSFIPNSSPVRSFGLRPVPRDDILI